jgi:hypothetical protein
MYSNSSGVGVFGFRKFDFHITGECFLDDFRPFNQFDGLRVREIFFPSDIYKYAIISDTI